MVFLLCKHHHWLYSHHMACELASPGRSAWWKQQAGFRRVPRGKTTSRSLGYSRGWVVGDLQLDWQCSKLGTEVYFYSVYYSLIIIAIQFNQQSQAAWLKCTLWNEKLVSSDLLISFCLNHCMGSSFGLIMLSFILYGCFIQGRLQQCQRVCTSAWMDQLLEEGQEEGQTSRSGQVTWPKGKHGTKNGISEGLALLSQVFKLISGKVCEATIEWLENWLYSVCVWVCGMYLLWLHGQDLWQVRPDDEERKREHNIPRYLQERGLLVSKRAWVGRVGGSSPIITNNT